MQFLMELLEILSIPCPVVLLQACTFALEKFLYYIAQDTKRKSTGGSLYIINNLLPEVEVHTKYLLFIKYCFDHGTSDNQ